jgi:hypothetical protein
MNAPAFLTAAALGVWGAQTGYWWIAAPLALAIEWARFATVRLDVGEAEFRRITDLCTLAFIGVAGYLVATRGMPPPILDIVAWLPLVLAPLVLAERYSDAGRVPLEALLLALRRPGIDHPWKGRQVGLGYPYVAACVVSAGAAGAANDRSGWFYWAVVIVAVWALWPMRSRRVSRTAWLATFALAAGLGFAIHVGLSRLQAELVDLAMDWLDRSGARTDPYRSSTDIGSLGSIKTSERIVLRVDPGTAARTPFLLHRASYNAYVSPSWVARDVQFAGVPRAIGGDASEGRWDLTEPARTGAFIVVSEVLARGRGVLSLPSDAARIDGLPALELKRNALGTVQVERLPGLAEYTVTRGAANGFVTGTTAVDLRVPVAEAGVVRGFVSEQSLDGRAPAEVVAQLKRLFGERFSYATWQGPRIGTGTPLADFLLHTRSGHCEYFATATVLLLRAAGIPARYATGYAVQEWSPREQRFLVRERHAHAWARAFVDGRWIDVDTTPPDWFPVEARSASALEPLLDAWSWARYRFARWQANRGTGFSAGWVALTVPLALMLVWRLRLRRRQIAFAGAAGAPLPVRAVSGADSAFYRVERALARQGLARHGAESMRDWSQRITRLRPELDAAALGAMVDLHYRHRFDPAGMPEPEARRLSELVARWLAARETQ